MKNKLLAFAGMLALVAVLGKFYATPLMAQVRAALVQDVDQPARAPFQAVVSITSTTTGYIAVPIPSGKRLVIDQVTANGYAQTTSGPWIQPIILLNSSVAGNTGAIYYLGPTNPTPNGQYYQTWPLKIYSDSLFVGYGYSGYQPSGFVFDVIVSGHLVSLP